MLILPVAGGNPQAESGGVKDLLPDSQKMPLIHLDSAAVINKEKVMYQLGIRHSGDGRNP